MAKVWLSVYMKLAAIYNVWADWDWLEQSYKNIRPLVDGVIVVASELSNYGEVCKIPSPWDNDVHLYRYYADDELLVEEVDPPYAYPAHSETFKRNYGLKIAREQGYTHFIMMDADEFYDPVDFIQVKKRFEVNHDLQGLVCASQVYVKSPTLTIGLDTTLVPFIQKITSTLKHEFNRNFPFAWTDQNGVPFTNKKRIRIDPTRSTTATTGIEWSSIILHHFSWVRKDYARKIRNSTAKANLERMDLANKIVHLKEGDIFDLYPGKPLVRVPNRFAIPEYGELAQDGIC